MGGGDGHGVEELPSAAGLIERFGLFGEGQGCHVEVDPRTAVLHCRCGPCGAWRSYLKGTLPGGPAHPQYEVLTRELVQALAGYVWQRALWAAGARHCQPFRVLEVGGGDGRLSHHLRSALGVLAGCPEGNAGALVEVACTDSGASRLHERSPHGHEVRLQAVDAALAAHAPHLVLASWMPLGADWTGLFRAAPSVLEYVLVGEPDSGICGTAGGTWGVGPSAPEGPQQEGPGAFERHAPLPGLLQLCCVDERWQAGGRSRVVAFRRREGGAAAG